MVDLVILCIGEKVPQLAEGGQNLEYIVAEFGLDQSSHL